MSYLDPSEHDTGVRPGTHRYGDGVSAYPLYGPDRSERARPAYEPGRGYEPGYDASRYGPGRGYDPNHDTDLDLLSDRAPSIDPRPGRAAHQRPPELAPAAWSGRAGRNLPAAIGVGLVLGAAVLASLFLWRPAFLGVIAAAVGFGTWELVRAVRTTGANPPLFPLVAGGLVMSGLAWWGQADALTFGLVVTILATMVWRLSDGAGGYGRDVTAATLIAVYLPFFAGFAALLARPADGDLRVLVMLAGVVLSDTGGYVAGVLFGRHPMAPSVSPKKSWEGFAGSLGATAIGGSLMLFFLFDGRLWQGAVFGLAVAASAVLGDLGESLLKRDLGVKDMSALLPGHGGVMDRLDSIVFAAPTAYLLLTLLAPPG